MRRILLVLVVFGVLTGIVLAGCGGDDGNGGEGDVALTKAQFVKQANGLCIKYNLRGEREFSEFLKTENTGGLGQAETIEQVEEIAIPILEEQIKDLRTLPKQKGEEKTIDLIISRQERSLEKVEDDPLFRVSGRPYEDLNKPARDYGLLECSR
jgi:hypothetical protein